VSSLCQLIPEVRELVVRELGKAGVPHLAAPTATLQDRLRGVAAWLAINSCASDKV
jgi:hypothetical protein